MTLEIGDAFSRSLAGSESTGCVASAQISLAPASTSRSAAAQIVPGGVDHVVDEDAVPTLDLADDVARLDGLPAVARTGLVHECEVRAESLAVALGDLHATRVGGHDDEVRRRVLAQVRLEDRAPR